MSRHWSSRQPQWDSIMPILVLSLSMGVRRRIFKRQSTNIINFTASWCVCFAGFVRVRIENLLVLAPMRTFWYWFFFSLTSFSWLTWTLTYSLHITRYFWGQYLFFFSSCGRGLNGHETKQQDTAPQQEYHVGNSTTQRGQNKHTQTRTRTHTGGT